MSDRFRRRTLRRAGLLLALLLLAAAAVAAVWGVRQASASNAWVEHTYRVIATLQRYRASLHTAEASARGYRLRPLPALRRAFSIAAPAVNADATTLATLVADNPVQQARARSLQQLTAPRLQVAEALMGGGDVGGLLLTGTEGTDRIERLAAAMLDEEQRLLDQRIAESAALERRLLALTIGGLSLAAVLLALLMSSLQREILRSRRLEAQTRDAATGLERSIATLHRLSEQRGILGRYASLLQSCQDIDEALRITGQVVAELLPGVGGRCYLLRASQDLAEAAITFGRAAVDSAPLLHPPQCWALRRGQPYALDSATTGITCAHVDVAVDAPPDAWTLCVPLLAQGTPLGLLYVAGDGATDRVEAQALVDNVAEQLGLALVNLQLRETLRMQSLRDPLTGLHNRRYLDESLPREITRCLRRNQSLAVLMLDVDHFKSFNDTHGHAAGDALLMAIARALQANTRGEDLVCRYGGEEFTVVLVDAAREDAMRRAEDIRSALGTVAIQHLRQTLGPRSVSIGLSMLPDDGQTPESLLQQADAALYRAKRAGRDRVVVAGAATS